MFDHGGVLDGKFIDSLDANNLDDSSDLILGSQKYDFATFINYLPNGKLCYKLINKIGEKCILGYHSNNKLSDQETIIYLSKSACNKANIQFPNFEITCVSDSNYTTNSSNPSMSIKNDLLILGFNDNLEGKQSTRKALRSYYSNIPKENIIIFDDGYTIVEQAFKEGHLAFLISNNYPLIKALEDCLSYMDGKISYNELLLNAAIHINDAKK